MFASFYVSVFIFLPILIVSVILIDMIYVLGRRALFGPKIDPELLEKVREVLEAPKNKNRSSFFETQSKLTNQRKTNDKKWKFF